MRAALALTAFAMPLLLSLPALADRIDGAWCRANSGRMVIDGPNIVTPGGAQTTGDYARHSFHYTVPAGEPGAGQKVDMILLGEEAVQVQVGGQPPVVWKRCGPAVS